MNAVSGPPVETFVVVESHGRTGGYPTTLLPSKTTSPTSSTPGVKSCVKLCE